MVVVDDHAGFRESVREILQIDGFVVVGEASNAAQAVAAVAALRPEVVLLDVQLPDLDGFVTAARIAALPDPPDIVLISSREAATYGAQVGLAPARGFIEKSDLSGAALNHLLCQT